MLDRESIDYRANVIKKTVSDKKIYIYESHRYILNILFDKYKKGELAEPITLIFFDKHDDARVLSEDKKQRIIEIRENLSECTYRQFYEFVEFEECTDNGGWLYTAIELGFIGDVVLFSSDKFGLNNLKDIKTEYLDNNKQTHNIFRLGNVWDEIDYQGALSDHAQDYKFKDIWDVLGWKMQEGHWRFLEEREFILDFDLDCFSGTFFGETIAIPNDLFYKKLKSYSSHSNCSAESFISSIIRKSKFITIAKEQYHCGGINESNRILNMLDDIFFNGELCE